MNLVGSACSFEQKLRSNVSRYLSLSMDSGRAVKLSQLVRSNVIRLVKLPKLSGSFVNCEQLLRLRCCSFPKPTKQASGISFRDAHPLRSRRNSSDMSPTASGKTVSTGCSGASPSGVGPPHLLRLRCRRFPRFVNSDSSAPETFIVQLSTSKTSSLLSSGKTSGTLSSISSILAMRSLVQGMSLQLVNASSTSSRVQIRRLSTIGFDPDVNLSVSGVVVLDSMLRPSSRSKSCISSTSSLPSVVASRLRVFKPDSASPPCTPSQYVSATCFGQP
mmetsp:Transcript_14825/g.44785  ORF Transcript_14825/g.44785 Transcript_14825/m.44785 type:complete len:275 (+) Transcript_14825:961-1785(+)